MYDLTGKIIQTYRFSSPLNIEKRIADFGDYHGVMIVNIRKNGNYLSTKKVFVK